MNGAAMASFRAAGAMPEDDPDPGNEWTDDLTAEEWARAFREAEEREWNRRQWIASTEPCTKPRCDDGLLADGRTCPMCHGRGRIRRASGAHRAA